eukprot:2168990-Amphidinium_carterae.1
MRLESKLNAAKSSQEHFHAGLLFAIQWHRHISDSSGGCGRTSAALSASVGLMPIVTAVQTYV